MRCRRLHLAFLFQSLAAWGVILILILACQVPAAESNPAPEGFEYFEKRVRPVLVESCYSCHSTKAEKLKGGLHLDSRAGMLTGGDTGPAIVPGNPEQSRLVEAIRYGNPDLQMPPKHKLVDTHIAALTAWIKMGAPWPAEAVPGKVASKPAFDLEQRRRQHWCWQPVRSQPLPAVRDQTWPLQPTDHFILARLEEAGMPPAPPAEKRTLLRRLYFDLIGLPPSPAEVEHFVGDPSPTAYMAFVERLLASPRFGERWGRHWLDLVRYAETLGHEFDYANHNAWRYRDYVIRALNADVPYDQFAREHIAGDLLPEPRQNPTEGFNESIIGPSFYWLGQRDHSPVDVRLHQAEVIDNQIDVLTKTFLGLTVACARCHDHKFDAIATKDYYALHGVLGSSRYAQRSIESQRQPVEQLQKVKAALRAALLDVWEREAANATGYLAAAAAATAPLPTTSGSSPGLEADGDLLFADFEQTDYGTWTTEGTAFGTGPQTQQTIGSYQGNVGAVGRGFVNSHNIRAGAGGDRAVGELISPTFRIERSYIHFLIGGGPHPGRTCLNLLINGQVVRTKTGQGDNRMKPARFEVAEFRGQNARLQLVDEETGGWGNVGLDHVVFSEREQYFNEENQPPLCLQPVDKIAAQFRLAPSNLERWIHALHQPPLPLTEAPTASANPRLTTAARGAADSNTVVFVDFTTADYRDWFVDGEAFGSRPTRAGDFLVGNSNQPVDAILSMATVHTALLSRRLQGVLRSPTFRIEKRYLHVWAAGREARLNIPVDNLTMIRDPIYGTLKQVLNWDQPRWLTVDLAMWQGHNAYLEFSKISTADPSDDGHKDGFAPDGWMTVQQVLFSDRSTPPTTPSPAPTEGRDPGRGTGRTGATWPPTGPSLRDAIAAWRADKADRFQIALLNWLAQNRLLLPEPTTADGQRLSGLLVDYRRLEAALKEPRRALSMVDGSGLNEHVFIRGNHKTPGEEVPRRFLEALTGRTAAAFREGSGRLPLARRVADPASPLFSRVFVNRVWLHLFGRGLVPTPDDFGVLGQPPTHPELLDWLAHWFRTEAEWHPKELIKLLVTSRAYQMSSQPGDAMAEEKDPANQLWHRADVRRLEGEAIRDSILAVSGQLDSTMFGPAVPIHLTEFMDGRGRPAVSGPLDGAGRRSIYVEVRRNFVSPMMRAFDTPVPHSTMGRRTVSNVPAQSLILLNDPFVLEQAKFWARRVLAAGERSSAERIRDLYLTTFARPPGPGEQADALAFLERQAASYKVEQTKTATSADESAWVDLCHVLWNVKEFVFIN